MTAPTQRRSELRCLVCGARHKLDQFPVFSSVKTRVPRGDVPMAAIGIVREWSQYGGPLYYRIAFDGGKVRENYAPCEIGRAGNDGADRVLRAVYVWCAMAAACVGISWRDGEPEINGCPWSDVEERARQRKLLLAENRATLRDMLDD